MRSTQSLAFPLHPCLVSFVVASRNDDHGGDMLKRTGVFIEGLLQLANKYSLAGELVIVEWNPPPGPRLFDAIQLRSASEQFVVRFIEVPPGIHQHLPNADLIPLFQLMAKNVGIRRARGEFILATNPDLLFSEDLIRFLASGNLRKEVMYRIDRHDVEANVPENVSLNQQLRWCSQHVLRVHRRRGSIDRRKRFRWPAVAWRDIPPNSVKELGYIITGASRLPKMAATLSTRLRGGMHYLLRGFARLIDPLTDIHTNGCGDFTLLAREQWFHLRGYPEMPIWSMHIDSLLCYMAVASGLRQEILRPPAMIFHLEHGHSWVVMSSEDRLRTFVKKPWLDLWSLEEMARKMVSGSGPIDYNAEDWGLGGVPLLEVVIHSGKRQILGPVAPVESLRRGSEVQPLSVQQ